jgi:hypothetical protein
LLDPGAPVVVVVDDTLFRRWGRKVHHAFWIHDGAAQDKQRITEAILPDALDSIAGSGAVGRGRH